MVEPIEVHSYGANRGAQLKGQERSIIMGPIKIRIYATNREAVLVVIS